MKQKLYIIGNGFDLHHGLKTSYYNFAQYLEKKDTKLYDLLERFVSYSPEDNSLWSRFEENLANLDADELLSENTDYLPDIGSDDFRDGDFHTFGYVMDKICKSLTSGLKEHFKEFILSIEYPDTIWEKKIRLDKEATFLNFNYTNTLERIYRINQKNIKYIHNSVYNSEEIILGHAIDPKKFEKQLPEPPESLTEDEIIEWYSENDSCDYSYDTGRNNLHKYFKLMHKPTADIISSNASFFHSLKDVEKIYVYGHSISQVDIPYFEEIVKYISKDTKWEVSYYDDESVNNLKQSLLDIGVLEENITFIRLEDIQENNIQLKFEFE